MHFDEILPAAGGQGPYQQLVMFLVFLPSQLPSGTQLFGQLVISNTPDYWCRVPAFDRDPELYFAVRWEMVKEHKNLEYLHKQCVLNSTLYGKVLMKVYKGAVHSNDFSLNSLSRVKTCSYGWYFNRSLLGYDENIVTEWNLVCDRSWLTTLSLTMFGLGEFLSLPLYFYVTYRHGRRFSFFLFLASQCLFGTLTAFSPNIFIFSMLRFLVGLTVPATIASPTAIAQELVEPTFRGWTIQLCYLFRSIGGVLLAGSVFVVRDWPQIALASTAPLVAFFMYWWVFPESPRWLLARGRCEETIRLLRSIANVNKRDLSPDFVVTTKRKFHLERSLSTYRSNPQTEFQAAKTLFGATMFRRRTILILFCWLISTSSFLGLNYFCLELHGDVYLNFLLSAISEVIGWLVAAAMLRCCSRRCSYCVTCALGGVLCVTMATRKKGKSASLTLFVSTKLSISISYFVLPLWTAELLPDLLRDTAFNVVDLLSLSCPFFLPLLTHQGRTFHSLPMTLIGVLQIFGGLLSLGLPESRLTNFLNPPPPGVGQCDNPWACECGPCEIPKIDPRNGISRSRGPPSPIFSLLRSQELHHASSGRDSALSEATGYNRIDRQISMDELKVTVL